MTQLADKFAVPEMSLICTITEYFDQNDVHYHPQILFQDVKVCMIWKNTLFYCAQFKLVNFYIISITYHKSVFIQTNDYLFSY